MGQLALSSEAGPGHGCCQGYQCAPPHLCGCFPAAAAGSSNCQKKKRLLQMHSVLFMCMLFSPDEYLLPLFIVSFHISVYIYDILMLNDYSETVAVFETIHSITHSLTIPYIVLLIS